MMDYRDKHKLYQISIFEEEKFKRKVAGLGVDDLKELKSYFDEAMPIAKRIKNVDLKIRLTNYKYLTAYMADDQTIKRMKLEEQKKRSMEKLQRIIDDEMAHLVSTEYRAAQEVPCHIILTTGEHYDITLFSSMTWLEMKKIYNRGFFGNNEPAVCGEVIRPDNCKKISKFHLKNGKSLVVRNSQIIRVIVDKVDEETMMMNIDDFLSKLEEITNKYNLSDFQIAQYFRN